MREIKFRAWHKEEKLMCDVSIINILDGAFCIGVKRGDDSIISGTRTIVLAPSDGRFCNWDEIELMQYTGLKDKNGVEIYEGDIVFVNTSGVDKKWGRNETVVWNEQYVGFAPFCFPRYTNDYGSYCEVIGNIYESHKEKG